MMHNTKKKFRIVLTVQYVIKHYLLLSLLLLITIAAAIVAGLLPPLILEQIVNRISCSENVTFLLVLIYFGILALSGLLNSAKEVMITRFGQKITRTLRYQMCEKIGSLPASYFVAHTTGELDSLMVNDVDTIQSLFSNGIISMVVNLIQIISIIAVIFVKSKGLGVIMLFVAPVIFAMTRVFQKRMLSAQLKNRSAIAKVSNHIPETIRNIRMIQNLMKQDYMERRYDRYIKQGYEAVERSNVYDSIYSPIILTISAMVVGAVMAFSSMGGTFASFFGMQVGTAVAIITYVGKVFDPIESLGMEIQNIQEALAGVQRVTLFMNEPEMQEKSIYIDQEKDKTEYCIELDHVSFSYDQNQTIDQDQTTEQNQTTDQDMVLSNQSLKIAVGENVTLIGRTGCGKSTVLKLILGLYSPEQGEVRVYGQQADQIADSSKRKLFGYVEQSFHMIQGTVADQISLKDPMITQAQIENAAKLVGMDEWIKGLNEGYDTPCQESLFSQGQMQLISIARAIVGNPSILLLDEITANLDVGTEERVLSAIDKAGADRTVISISHRIYEHTKQSRLIEL